MQTNAQQFAHDSQNYARCTNPRDWSEHVAGGCQLGRTKQKRAVPHTTSRGMADGQLQYEHYGHRCTVCSGIRSCWVVSVMLAQLRSSNKQYTTSPPLHNAASQPQRRLWLRHNHKDVWTSHLTTHMGKNRTRARIHASPVTGDVCTRRVRFLSGGLDRQHATR